MLRPTLSKTFWGGEVDVTDGQWSSFRANLPLLGMLALVSSALTQLMFRVGFRFIRSERWRALWATTQRCLFAFAFAIVIHRYQLLVLLGALLLHFVVVKLLIGRKLFGIDLALLFSWSYCLIGIFAADKSYLQYFTRWGFSYYYLVYCFSGWLVIYKRKKLCFNLGY